MLWPLSAIAIIVHSIFYSAKFVANMTDKKKNTGKTAGGVPNQLEQLAENLRRISRDRNAVLSQHETFELIDEMRESVDQLLKSDSSK